MANKKTTKTKTPKAPDVMQVLSPEDVPWEIGGLTFYQRPLRLDLLGAAMQEIIDTVFEGGRAEILDQLIDTVGQSDTKAMVARQQFTPALIRMLVGIPARLPRVIASCLGGADEEHLLIHLRGPMALKIVQTFVEQNEIGGLIEGFFGLIGSVTESVTEATAALAEETPETEPEEPEEPEEETEKTEEASEPQ